MFGERTWTSAMSGAATNTVAAGPGSLSAVPLLTSSVSVGASVGTTWLWPNGRPAAPPVTTGAGGLAGPAAGGWIGTGAGEGVGAWANCGAGADGVTAAGGCAGVAWPAPTSVREALTIGGRGGMAATVGGSESTMDLVSTALASTVLLSACIIAGVASGEAMAGDEFIARTACAVRSNSRRLRSSETLSVAVCRDAAFLAGACGLGLAGTLSGSLIWTCASNSEGWKAKASDAASASDEPRRRQAGGLDAKANDGLIAVRSLGYG